MIFHSFYIAADDINITIRNKMTGGGGGGGG